MHGDADLHTKQIVILPHTEESKNYIVEIIELCNCSNSDWPYRQEIEEKYEEINKRYSTLLINYMKYPLLQRDSTNVYECVCRPSFKSLTYFNELGIECKVKLKKT